MTILDPKAIAFAKGFRKLVEETGYTIASCGCCPPGPSLADDPNGVSFDDMADYLLYRRTPSPNGEDRRFSDSEEEREKARQEILS